MFYRILLVAALSLWLCERSSLAQAPAEQPTTQQVVHQFTSGDGKYQFTIDTSETPDLTEWADTKLAPVVKEWYPKLVEMLPSDGFTAPATFSITFRQNMGGVANTGGTRINCAGRWYRQNLKGEAIGSIVHEMVHVVQQYGYGGGRRNPGAPRNPVWLVEGIPDYIRWFKYEPQTHGADIRNPDRARYDGNYRISANFLNFAVEKYDPEIIQKLNAALRQRKYNDDLWKELTGKTVQELNDEWKASLKKPS
jgi:hypothetical protein